MAPWQHVLLLESRACLFVCLHCIWQGTRFCGPNASTVVVFCFYPWKGIIVPSLVSHGLIFASCMPGWNWRGGWIFLSSHELRIL